MLNKALQIKFLPHPCFNPTTLFLGSDAQQCPQLAASQPPQPTLDVPLPGESKEEVTGGPHVRAGSGSGSERPVDPVKIETIGGGASRQASGPPGQGYSKYQKSLPPRFQRQQQVKICPCLLFEVQILFQLVFNPSLVWIFVCCIRKHK